MDDGLKQRIIAAIVLFALGVIFIPFLFDQTELDPVDTRSLIPPVPYIEQDEISVVDPTLKNGKLNRGAQIFNPSENDVVDPISQEDIGLTRDKQVKSWVLEVASFMQKAHADQLADDLDREGYPVFIRLNAEGENKLFRVMVGPKLDKQRLTADQQAIEAKYKTKSMMMVFKP